MDTEDKIYTVDLAQEIKIAIKDIFIAKMRRCRDEIHLDFPNGQKFTVDVMEDDGDKPGSGALAKRKLEELSSEDYSRWFESRVANWIVGGIYMVLGLKVKQKGNEIYVPLANGQPYIIKIQKG